MKMNLYIRKGLAHDSKSPFYHFGTTSKIVICCTTLSLLRFFFLHSSSIAPVTQIQASMVRDRSVQSLATPATLRTFLLVVIYSFPSQQNVSHIATADEYTEHPLYRRSTSSPQCAFRSNCVIPLQIKG